MNLLTINRQIDSRIPVPTNVPIALTVAEDAVSDEMLMDRVFFALSDPVRRKILERLDEEPQLVSELAAPFDITLQAVSRHIQVLVRAGLIVQQRTGRISRCSLVAGPIFTAAVWINRYSKYWQEQFDMLASALGDIEGKRPGARKRRQAVRKRKAQRRT
jgi:DNA-binding transcriptional ArsR family regulator